jgi:hypothetical protein
MIPEIRSIHPYQIATIKTLVLLRARRSYLMSQEDQLKQQDNSPAFTDDATQGAYTGGSTGAGRPEMSQDTDSGLTAGDIGRPDVPDTDEVGRLGGSTSAGLGSPDDFTDIDGGEVNDEDFADSPETSDPLDADS